MSPLLGKVACSSKTARYTRPRKLRFDVLEERTLMSVTTSPDLSAAESATIMAGIESSLDSTFEEQSIVSVGFLGNVEATGDSVETGTRYRIFDYWGGVWTDAEKDTQAGDDLMCWAGAAANVLEWTGWGKTAGMTNSDQMFQYFQDHWTDQGGLPQFGWDWWLSGINPQQGVSGWSQVDVAGGNFYPYPDYWYTDYVFSRGQGSAAQTYAMADVDQYCRAGYGVSLGVFGSIAHAITCWGFNYDTSLAPSNPNYYKGIWVTDSDDSKYTSNGVTAPNTLHYYAVSWNSSYSRYDLNSYVSGAFIGEVDGLARLIQDDPDPDPTPDGARADFDGNGISDVVWHNQSTGEVGAWLVQENGSLAWRGLGSAPANTWKVSGVGDFNGDGTADVLWRNLTTSQVGVWLVSAGGISWKGLGYASATEWKISGVADFDGDGIDDTLWHNQTSGDVSVCLVKNDSPVITRSLGSAPANVWKVGGIGDFDGDDIADVLWHNQITGEVGAWLVKVGAPNQWAGLGAAPANVWSIAGVGDHNGDGYSDVLWHNQTTGAVGAWLINNGHFSSWRSLGAAPANTWTAIGFGDYDANGNADVLWRNNTTSQVGAWLVQDASISWRGFGSASTTIWKPICSDTISSIAANNATFNTQSLARFALNTIDSSNVALLGQHRWDAADRSALDHGALNADDVDRLAFHAAPVTSSTFGLCSDHAQFAGERSRDIVNPGIVDRIDLPDLANHALEPFAELDRFVEDLALLA